jgi:archaellum component FlaC
MKAQKIHPVIIEEITTPQRSRRPIDELGENISQTRANRLRRAETPTKNIKTQVDKIASAATRFRDKEAEVNRLKDFVFEDIKNIGGKVVAISKDGTFDIKISEGKQRISPRIQKKITQLRREAADAGAFSLETAGVGYSIAAAPLRIAQPTAQKGSITQNINNFIKAKKELAQLKNEFGRAKISALPAMVDDRFNRLIDGSEIRSFIGQGEKVPVEVQLRRKVSKFDPDLDVKIPGTGKTFKGEIKRLKGEGKKEGGRGAKFLATRQIKKPETIAKKSAEGQVINLNTPVTDLPSENKLTTRQRRQLNRKLGVPRTRFTRRKPAVNDKGEIGFKPRPQVDETKARRLNREISNDLNKLTKSQTGAFKIIGNTVPEFKLKGQINLVGKTFKNETDLAQMTQIFSDPRTESSRLLFVKGNEIKGVIGMTARLPGSTPSIPVDFHSNVDFLNVMMKKHGADSFYMLHNHPLGDVNPSIADIKVSSVQAQQNKTFRGHCIINHDKFSLIMPNKLKGHTEVTDYKGDAKDVFTYTLPLKTPRKREASINHPLLDASISKVQDVSDIAQRLNNQNDFGYIFSTKVAKGKIRVTGVTQISKNFLKSGNDKKIKAAIRRISKETGSEDTYLTLDKSTIEKHINTFSDLVSGGFIHDVVDSTSGISLRRGLRKRHVPVGGRASMSRKQFGKTIEETRIRILSQGGADQKTVALLNSFLGIRGKGKLTTAETTAFARDLGAISPNDARDFNSSIQKFDANISQALESPSISFNDKFDLTNLKNKIDTKFFKKTEKDIEAGDAPNPTFLDKVSELRAGMLLFRLSSVGKSIASNTARKLVQYPELKLSAWINKGVSRRSNTLQSRFAKEAEIDFATTWANRHRGINDAKNIMTESDKGKSQSIFFKREQIKGPAISGTKGKVIRAGLNAQGALDSIFRLPSEQGAIARHVYRKAMQESNFNHLDALAKSEKMMADVQSHLKAAKDGADIPDDIKTIIDKAKKEVEELTFQSELTGFAKKLSELRSSETTGGKVMRTLVPFFNTHMNILKQSFERTPLGLMTPRMSRLIKKHVRKELTELEAGELSDKMAQVVSGTGFMLGAAGMLYAMGDNMEITGDFDINTIKNKPQGWQPNSIRVGDIYISYQPFEPAASLLKIFGNAADTEHTIPNASLMGKSASVLAKSFLTNPLSEENFDLVNGLARGKADEILVDLAVSTVTFGMLADIGKIIDPAIKVKDSLTDKAIGKASIPGTTLTLPARVDIFGEDLITQSRGERAIKTITGVSVSQIKDSDERKFIRGLGIKPSQSRMKFKGVELTTQENLRVNKQAGIRFKEAVTSLMKSKSFTGLPKDRQTKILNRIRKKMISAYKKSLLSEANFRKRLTDKLKEGK